MPITLSDLLQYQPDLEIIGFWDCDERDYGGIVRPFLEVEDDPSLSEKHHPPGPSCDSDPLVFGISPLGGNFSSQITIFKQPSPYFFDFSTLPGYSEITIPGQAMQDDLELHFQINPGPDKHPLCVTLLIPDFSDATLAEVERTMSSLQEVLPGIDEMRLVLARLSRGFVSASVPTTFALTLNASLLPSPSIEPRRLSRVC